MSKLFCTFVVVSLPAIVSAKDPPAVRIAEFRAVQTRVLELRSELVLLQAAYDDAEDADAEREILRETAQRQGEMAELVAKISRARRVLHDSDPREWQQDVRPPPMLSGRVVAMKWNFVEISLGSDDGLRVGHRLDVSRDGMRGQIVVRRTDPDCSIGEIISDRQAMPIRIGDYVHPSW